MKQLGLLLLVVISCVSCTRVSNMTEYKAFCNDPDNGLVKSKTVAGIKMTIKYMAPDFLAYRELGDAKNQQKLDSLTNYYSQSKTFLINLDLEEGSGELLTSTSPDFEAYTEKFKRLNFEMESMVSIQTDLEEYHPVLSQVSNTYGLKQGTSVLVVFVPNSDEDKSFYEAETFDFILQENLFNLGINHFSFEGDQLRDTPKLKNIL